MRRFITLLLLLSIFIIPVSAHPGRTDANGGHWDHSTGTYHYHDGSSAGKNNKSSESTATYPTIRTPSTVATSPAAKPTSNNSSTSSSQTVQKNSDKSQGVLDMVGWIVSGILFLLLISSSRSHKRESESQYIAIHQKEMDLQKQKDTVSSLTLKVEKMEEEKQDLLNRIIFLHKDLDMQKEKMKEIISEASISDGESIEEKNISLSARVLNLQENIKRLQLESRKQAAYVKAAERNVTFDKNGRPIHSTPSIDKKHPYGDWTVFINDKSKIFHFDYLCASTFSRTAHLFDVNDDVRPCQRCARAVSRGKPEWYLEIENDLKL